MNKKIFRSSLLTVCLVLIAIIALIMELLFRFFEKQIQTELANEAVFLAQAIENEGTGYFEFCCSAGQKSSATSFQMYCRETGRKTLWFEMDVVIA